MPQSLDAVAIHLVFSTKQRQPFLQTKELQVQVHKYLIGILQNIKCEPIQVGGTQDHVHILCRLSRTMAISNLVRNLKISSSRYVRTHGCKMFAWQNGYGAFSVSESNRKAVVAYISSQEEHHKKMSFEDEYRVFLRRHHIAFDERFVWD